MVLFSNRKLRENYVAIRGRFFFFGDCGSAAATAASPAVWGAAAAEQLQLTQRFVKQLRSPVPVGMEERLRKVDAAAAEAKAAGAPPLSPQLRAHMLR